MTQLIKPKPQRKKLRCPWCHGTRYKIVHTHGMKSPGYKVCKDCGGLIK